MIRLTSIYQGYLDRIRRTFLIDKRSDVLEGDGGWQQWAPANFGLIFSTSFGRWWWQTAFAEDEIKAAGDELLESMMGSSSPNACKDYFDGFRRSLANEASQL